MIMLRKTGFILAILLVVLLVWFWAALPYGGFFTINGHMITGPLGSFLGAILTAIILFCVAVLLAFVFAGVGLVVFGSIVLVGFILATIALPFLLPILIPLLIIWLVCSIAGKTKTA
jgi:hypothetical protein